SGFIRKLLIRGRKRFRTIFEDARASRGSEFFFKSNLSVVQLVKDDGNLPIARAGVILDARFGGEFGFNRLVLADILRKLDEKLKICGSALKFLARLGEKSFESGPNGSILREALSAARPEGRPSVASLSCGCIGPVHDVCQMVVIRFVRNVFKHLPEEPRPPEIFGAWFRTL